MIKVIVNGAKGKMGVVTCQAVKEQSDFELVGELGREHDLSAEIKRLKPDIVIDFTSSESAYQNALTIIENDVYGVIGSTGLTDQHIQHLSTLCHDKKVGCIIAPNFSLAAVLMMKFSQMAAKYFDWCEIIELHHAEKKEAPSGTAMKTASLISAVRQNQTSACHEIVPHARGAVHHSIPIHSIRMPGLLAHQEVIFGELGETLTIRHDSTDRKGYMPGVIKACREVITLDHLIYGLESILEVDGF